MQILKLLEKKAGNADAYGSEFRFNCPFCPKIVGKIDTLKCLSVNQKKKKFQCFRCETKGHINYLAKLFGLDIEVPHIEPDWADKARARLKTKTKVIPYPSPLIQDYIPKNSKIEKNSVVYKYLRFKRKLSERTMREYGLKQTERNQVFIPMYYNGLLVYWQTRETNKYIHPKYDNPNKDTGAHKSKVLFNIDRANKYKDLIICEGAFSAIGAGPNAIALLGKKASPHQMTQLIRSRFERYFVVLDGDPVGRKNGIKLTKELARKNKEVYYIPMPDGTDPGNHPINYEGAKSWKELHRCELELIE